MERVDGGRRAETEVSAPRQRRMEIFVDSINAATTTASDTGGRPVTAMADLTSQDFLKLLVTQLTYQDPLEPMGNEELLRQISSIREIELSTTLSDSLRNLTGQQHFSSVSGMIGQHVTTVPDEVGATVSGVVVGVRFTSSGEAVLVLSNGVETPLQQVAGIQSPLRAAEALVGQHVIGVDRQDPGDPRAVEGVVTSVRVDEQGEPVLELDSGDALRMRDLVGAAQEAPV
jgi:flagellar basal-body rod modification protein FlgD